MVLAVVVVAACARPALQAALDLMKIAAIATGVLGLVGGAVAVLVRRARRQRATAVPAARPVVLTAAGPAGLGHHTTPEAIEAPHANASAYLRINAIPHVVTSDDAPRDRCPYLNCHHNHPELSPSRPLRREEDKRDG
jgi:hypothetical protein